jgi:hypothetical protein
MTREMSREINEVERTFVKKPLLVMNRQSRPSSSQIGGSMVSSDMVAEFEEMEKAILSKAFSKERGSKTERRYSPTPLNPDGIRDRAARARRLEKALNGGTTVQTPIPEFKQYYTGYKSRARNITIMRVYDKSSLLN